MAYVDLAKNLLVLKVAVVGPPAVGKTTRLRQVGNEGRFQVFGSKLMAETTMAVLPLVAEGTPRPVEIELYEWHGPEKVDVRAKALWTGLDGLIFIADARADRYVDSVAMFKFLLDEAGKTRLVRVPSLLVLGWPDEGLLRLERYAKDLQGPTWSDRLESPVEPGEPFIEAVKMLGEAMLARML